MFQSTSIFTPPFIPYTVNNQQNVGFFKKIFFLFFKTAQNVTSSFSGYLMSLVADLLGTPV